MQRRAALLAESKSVWEIAKQNKEKYLEEMEAYKQRKEEESANLKKEEDEMMKIQKQEALQLLQKKEKTDNIIKKMKGNHQKKKKISDPNKLKKPTSSFLLFSKARKNLLEERPGINNSAFNDHISVKWKESSEEDKQTWNEKAAGTKMELEEYNKFAAMEKENNNNPKYGEEPTESLFLKELKKQGMNLTSLLEESNSSIYGDEEIKFMEEEGGSSKRNAVSTDYEKSLSNQRERSVALNSEGLD
ncbi:unnamed protein product [Camellia sinensis]